MPGPYRARTERGKNIKGWDVRKAEGGEKALQLYSFGKK